MPSTTIDGIDTYYETQGTGAPILMCAPGGFEATIDKWRTATAWTGMDAIKALAAEHTVILYDRRESGRSGGRVERLSWSSYTRHGKALLDHLKIDSAWIMGGCMGCCPVVAFGVSYPEATLSMILYWPVGGAKYRINNHLRFAEHLAYVQQHNLEHVVQLVRKEGKAFNADARGGPWASVIKNDEVWFEFLDTGQGEELTKLADDFPSDSTLLVGDSGSRVRQVRVEIVDTAPVQYLRVRGEDHCVGRNRGA